MGIGKTDVDAMSLWELSAAVEGFNRAHSPEKESAALSDEDAEDLSRWMDELG